MQNKQSKSVPGARPPNYVQAASLIACGGVALSDCGRWHPREIMAQIKRSTASGEAAAVSGKMLFDNVQSKLHLSYS